MTQPAPPVDPLTIPWRPNVNDVAALIRARTKDAQSNEVGTFTDNTRPTDAEVEELITNGCAKVASFVGWNLPADAEPEARHLAALWTACEIEQSYWPEQVRSDRSPFAQLMQMFTFNIAQFVEYVGQLSPGGVLGARTGTLPTPSATVVWAYTYGFGWPTSDLMNTGLGQ